MDTLQQKFAARIDQIEAGDYAADRPPQWGGEDPIMDSLIAAAAISREIRLIAWSRQAWPEARALADRADAVGASIAAEQGYGYGRLDRWPAVQGAYGPPLMRVS